MGILNPTCDVVERTSRREEKRKAPLATAFVQMVAESKNSLRVAYGYHKELGLEKKGGQGGITKSQYTIKVFIVWPRRGHRDGKCQGRHHLSDVSICTRFISDR